MSIIQESIDSAVNWTIRNDMKINSEKSKEMIISFTQYINYRNYVPNIVIEGKPVKQVDHAKLLGFTLSNDLTWKKTSKRVYLMYQLKRAGISQCDLIRVYMSVVRPVLEYACPVLHTNLPKYLSDNIELFQKSSQVNIIRTY